MAHLRNNNSSVSSSSASRSSAVDTLEPAQVHNRRGQSSGPRPNAIKGDELSALLDDIQLESFGSALRDQLQITRLSHFDYVTDADLEAIGMSKPAIRRLLDAMSRRRRAADVLSFAEDDQKHDEQQQRRIGPVRPPPPPPPLPPLPASLPTSSNSHQEFSRNNSLSSSFVGAAVYRLPVQLFDQASSLSISPNRAAPICASTSSSSNRADRHDVTFANSKLYNSNISKTFLKYKGLSLSRVVRGSQQQQQQCTNNDDDNCDDKSKTKSVNTASPNSSESSSDASSKPVSVIINANDLVFMKANDGTGDDILGTGQFGVVKRAIWTTHTGAKLTVAVKSLRGRDDDSSGHQSFADMVNEIACMCSIHHKHLVQLHGIVLSSSASTETEAGIECASGRSSIMMVTELAPYGALLTHLREARRDSSLPVPLLYSYVYQVASGMEYLESQRLVHRDLAARNVLLHTLEHVKICDLGMAKRCGPDGTYSGGGRASVEQQIPCAWYAPESIRERLFSARSDVWMFGVCAWEVFALGEAPWPHMSAAAILQAITIEKRRLAAPVLCAPAFYALLQLCWSNNAAERPSFSIIKQLIKATRIVDMKAKEDFRQPHRLEIERGDVITIIVGDAAHHWWTGQNRRTLRVGSFPRAILDPQRRLRGEDISLPLRNSFIHTGHMGADSTSGRHWGNPGKIDEIFLRNPLAPPDLLSDIQPGPRPLTKTTITSTTAIQPLPNDPATANLIDLLDSTPNDEDVRVSYPTTDYSRSIDSFAPETILTPSRNRTIVSRSPSNYQQQQRLYVNEPEVDDSWSSTPHCRDAELAAPASYYNDCFALASMEHCTARRPHDGSVCESSAGEFSSCSVSANRHGNFAAAPPAYTSAAVDADRSSARPMNPFASEMCAASTSTPASKALPLSSSSHPRCKSAANANGKLKFGKTTTTAKLGVDELLNKVMNDVMHDFKKLNAPPSSG